MFWFIFLTQVREKFELEYTSSPKKISSSHNSRVPIQRLLNNKKIGYCYHSVNVIKRAWSQRHHTFETRTKRSTMRTTQFSNSFAEIWLIGDHDLSLIITFSSIIFFHRQFFFVRSNYLFIFFSISFCCDKANCSLSVFLDIPVLKSK